jgi:hypothetical protein
MALEHYVYPHHYRHIHARAVNEYVCGLDLGRQHDRSVFAVIHHTRKPVEGEGGWVIDDTREVCRQASVTRYDLVHMHALPLKLDYVSQALMVRELMAREPLESTKATLVVDTSGVGQGVADLMRSQGLRFKGVQITAGTEQTQVDGSNYRVAKQLLVSKLEAVLHAGELRVPDALPDAEPFRKELESFRRQSKASGAQTWSADVGEFDDRVMATSYAIWWCTSRSTTTRTPLSI